MPKPAGWEEAHKAMFDVVRRYSYDHVREFNSRNAFCEHMEETAVRLGREAGTILNDGELQLMGVDCARWTWDKFRSSAIRGVWR
jgi:hypothetical protein